MNRTEIKNKLIDKLAILFENTNIDYDLLEYIDLIDDLGMDSITFITIIVEIEALFGIIVPDEKLQMDYFKNVCDIVEIVAKELAGNSGKEEA
ncbi:MAG: acyl carrier protein [Clostridiales bacterium]|nr:acyl carrier protein [Clostridiales bacterium]